MVLTLLYLSQANNRPLLNVRPALQATFKTTCVVFIVAAERLLSLAVSCNVGYILLSFTIMEIVQHVLEL